MRMKAVWSIFLAGILGGCAETEVAIPPADVVTKFQGQPLTIVARTTPNFTFTTPGRAAFEGGPLGKPYTADDTTLLRDNGVEDPAVAMAARLATTLAVRMHTTGPALLPNQTSSDAATLARAAGGRGAVLDVQTAEWTILYFPFDWTHYRLVYSGRARLIDGISGKVLSEGPCSYGTRDDPDPPSYDEVLANSAAWLKAKLAQLQERCVSTYETALLPD